MPSPINIYASQITPRQKKDLLGIYQDYLYFIRGVEFSLQINTHAGLAAMFMKHMNWLDSAELRWDNKFTTSAEKDAYVSLTNGTLKDPGQYAYMSLYHTQKEQDVAHKKISKLPDGYTYTTIDFDLPSPIERYGIALPAKQKLKDAKIIIDGLFKITFNNKYEDQGDTPLIEILEDYKTQKEFKVMLCILEYYRHNMYELESTTFKDASRNVTHIMLKMMAAEVLSGFENKAMDLIGSYADKSQEILRSIFSNASTKDLWKIAEKNGLIASAENMQHFLNIRHLIRHQWDILDGSNKFADGDHKKNRILREEYMASYHFLFDKSIGERIAEYQKISRQLQHFLKALYPEFLTREVGESNSKFVKRIKQWQQQNPDKIPLISGNYSLKDDKHTSLISNLKKVVPSAIVLDDLNANELEKYYDMEKSYFNRTSFLRTYNHLESSVTLFCQKNGVALKPADIWKYLITNVFDEEEYQKWSKYRQLRNKLSHNYFNQELRVELDQKFEQFEEDATHLRQKLKQLTLALPKQQEQAPIQKQTSSKYTLRTLKKTSPRDRTVKKYPFKLIYGDSEILECKFDNGIAIDLKRKKIIFPDNTRLYFDAENYNVFRFENGNKLFTDKTFIVTKFLERGHLTPISRNENCIVAPKHKIRTDKNNRITEDCILQDNKKLITRFDYKNNNAFIILEDGTQIKSIANDIIVSHSNIELSYENRYTFKQSYLEGKPLSPSPTPFKPPFSR